jgi:hypothetical protein
MSVSLIEKRPFPHPLGDDDKVLSNEVMVFCPSCKAFETLWFTSSALNQTRKFTQYGNHIYHDCGSNEPCRLYTAL